MVSHWLMHRMSIIRTKCWNIVNLTLRNNKLQWNLNQNSHIFIQENSFENIACEMAAILSWPHCVNPLRLSEAYMCQWTRPSLVQIMACRVFGAKPLSEPIVYYCQLDLRKRLQSNCIQRKFKKILLKMSSAKWRPFCLSLNVLSVADINEIW